MGKRKEQRFRGNFAGQSEGIDMSGRRFLTLATRRIYRRKALAIAGPLPDLPIARKVWVHFHRQKACFEVVRFRRDGSIAEVGLNLRFAKSIVWGQNLRPH
jgi:hypothetical protein